jgi:hypothetical protein
VEQGRQTALPLLLLLVPVVPVVLELEEEEEEEGIPWEEREAVRQNELFDWTYMVISF